MIRSTFAIPAILGVITLTGLIAALAGDGLPDVLSWIALALPVAAVGWAYARRSSTRTQPRTKKGN